MRWERQPGRGFTIVELLIVVVVIAILATITIVSYNGITENARISSAKAFATQVYKRDINDAQGFWGFDECNGSTAANSGGQAPALQSAIGGTVAWSTDTPFGRGCSLVFNGGSTYVDTAIGLSNSYYFKSAWIKTASSSSSQNIISSSVGGGSASAAFYLASGNASAGHNSNWNQVRASTVQYDGKWHHVAVEFTRNGTASNGTMKLFVDGAQVSVSSSVPLMTNETETQVIGRFGGSSYFSGLMDDVMIVVK